MNRDELLTQITRTADRPSGRMLPTGSAPLDALLGGGWPGSVISEISGPPGYAAPAAYRTIAAVQRWCRTKPALLCCGDFSPQLARKHGVQLGRLLVTQTYGDALKAAGAYDLSIAVADATTAPLSLVRGDRSLTVVCLTREPGEVRSTACIQLSRYGGRHGWARADRMWHTWHPDKLRFDQMLIHGGRDAFVQELLDVALVYGTVTSRARWYAHGDRKLGHGWEAAVSTLRNDASLRTLILADVAARIPVHSGWPEAYT